MTSEEKPTAKYSLPVLILTALFILALGMAGYFYSRYTDALQATGTMEIETLVKKIGSVVSLPNGETPTLATVTNKEKLDNQPFFQKAENGDKILIYADSSRVILYRPSTERVIDMSTVNVVKDSPEEATASDPDPVTPIVSEGEIETMASAEEAPLAETVLGEATDDNTLIHAQSATVALYNGSVKIGVTNTLETKLTEQFPALAVTLKEKAVKNDYQGNVVIDLTGKNAILSKGIADAIGGLVETVVPLGEVRPDADILIIAGNK